MGNGERGTAKALPWVADNGVVTIPLGSFGGYGRRTISEPSSTAPVPMLARNTALSVPDSPVTMLAAAPLVRVTADHLALVRGLIDAGQPTRALELLDAVWHPRVAEEQCWYLRLWILTVQGQVLEALDLARLAADELPGSAAVAYLQAALEHASDSPAAALEAARRARAIASDQPLPAMLPNPVAAAQVGAALLFPLRSGRALIPPVPSAQRKGRSNPTGSLDPRHLGLIALVTAACAVWAIDDLLPAATVVAFMVVLTLRGWRV